MSTSRKRKNEARDADNGNSKRPNINYKDILTVLVGREEEKIAVQQETICAKSKFFQAACKKDWKEGQEKLVRLPEMSPYAFSIYVHWVYTGELSFENIPYDPPFDESATRVDHADGDSDVCDFIDLFCTYVTADSLMDSKLANYAISECIKANRIPSWELPNACAITYMWNNTNATSMLRKWLLDMFPTQISPDDFVTQAEDYPAEFILEMAKKLVVYIQEDLGEYPRRKDACKYHDHNGNDEPCPDS